MAKAFDGTGDAYVINNPNKGHATLYSVSFWFKATNPNDQTIVNYGRGTTTAAGTGWDFVIRANNTLRWNSYSGGSNFQLPTATTFTDDTWYHVALVREDLWNHKVYVNGSLTDTLAIDPATVQTSTDDFHIGKPVPDNNAGFGAFIGKIAHVAYWQNKALTLTEVQSIADKSTCEDAIHPTFLQVFVKLISGAVPVDGSANAFTVVEEGNPTDDAGPGSLPCEAVAATAKRFGLLGVG